MSLYIYRTLDDLKNILTASPLKNQNSSVVAESNISKLEESEVTATGGGTKDTSTLEPNFNIDYHYFPISLGQTKK